MLLAEENLSTSAKVFLTSVYNYFKKHKGLTEPQYKSFEKAESKFSPEAKVLEEQWRKEYDSDKKRDFKIACDYYDFLGKYFTDWVTKAKEDLKFVPTRQQFEKMVQNKFTQKVIKATLCKPKYNKKDLVQLRKNVPSLPRGVDSESIAYIMKINSSSVTSSARGAKKYQILPFGQTEPIEVEERHIKRYCDGKGDE